jgi:hypothetical protein
VTFSSSSAALAGATVRIGKARELSQPHPLLRWQELLPGSGKQENFLSPFLNGQDETDLTTSLAMWDKIAEQNKTEEFLRQVAGVVVAIVETEMGTVGVLSGVVLLMSDA